MVPEVVMQNYKGGKDQQSHLTMMPMNHIDNQHTTVDNLDYNQQLSSSLIKLEILSIRGRPGIRNLAD